MLKKKWMFLSGAMLLAAATPVQAGWTVMTGGQQIAVAKSSLTLTPKTDWNRSSARPSTKGELWTLDGASLNELTFYAGIGQGEPLFKERQKAVKPLPKFSAAMLPTDIPQFLEESLRVQLDTAAFTVESVAPATLAGKDGVQFSYRYTVEADNLERRGEARAAVIGGKLYLINFVAPKIYYFDRDIAGVRAMMDSAKL
jgi:hypothetical protein